MRRLPRNLVLDAGAVLAFARGDRLVRGRVDAAIRSKASVFVSAVTLTEVVRGEGPRDAPVNRVLRPAGVVPVSEDIGRRAGKLLARARSSATVDAVVVATALDLPGGALILTSDTDDLMRLTEEQSDVRVVGV